MSACTEPWFTRELEQYQAGKDRLARMMGRDPSSFSQEDVDVRPHRVELLLFLFDSLSVMFCLHHFQEALRYLLPTRLSARDARPALKVTHGNHLLR